LLSNLGCRIVFRGRGLSTSNSAAKTTVKVIPMANSWLSSFKSALNTIGSLLANARTGNSVLRAKVEDKSEQL
jgi:hypothetical protein